MHFRFTDGAIDTQTARRELLDQGAGGYVSFEGWVRDFNEGQEVTRLEYEAFQELALKEGERIVCRSPCSAFPSSTHSAFIASGRWISPTWPCGSA
jgi:molybdopterin synthase catalytic subunit